MKKRARQASKFIFLTFLILSLYPLHPLWAVPEDDYERYAAIWPPEGFTQAAASKSSEGLGNFENRFLTYPFELIRWPVNKTLIYVEEIHLKDKVDWIYEQMKDFGISPTIRKGGGLADGLGGGINIEFVKLAHLKERYPDLSVEGSGLWTLDPIQAYSLKIRQERILETGFFAGTTFRYENRGKENFYGIGPETSLGDGTVYRMERTAIEGFLGCEFLNTWNVKTTVGYRNVNITHGEDGGRGVIDTIFVATSRQNIPGLAGDEIFSANFDLEHDNRDSKDVPTEGGYERFRFSVNKGMENDAGYFKYRAEVAHFLKLFSDRRIFAFRGIAEQNHGFNDRKVPFFEMARLGGYGAYPRFGDVHRGYKRDRFYDENLFLFNVEYRWAAWEYKSWTMDSVLFSDIGQVFDRWRDFSFGDFRWSYGLGFRVSLEKNILLAVEIARANEGTEIYVTSKAPF